jgi:peroxiredoxin
MARTESTMLALGTEAPDFALTDVLSGKVIHRDDFRGRKALLVLFICPHCPFVKHMEKQLGQLGRDYENQPLAIIAINSNDAVAYPADNPEGMKRQADTFGFLFPYLFDESQSVAKAYQAACTPDFFLFDADFRLVYRGQFDASRPSLDIPITGEDLRKAINAVLAGEPVTPDQRASLGCNIKWKE